MVFYPGLGFFPSQLGISCLFFYSQSFQIKQWLFLESKYILVFEMTNETHLDFPLTKTVWSQFIDCGQCFAHFAQSKQVWFAISKYVNEKYL